MNGRTNSAGGALVSDMEIPLDPCTDFVGVRIKDLEYLGKVRLTWTDPKDKYATPEGEAMEDTDQLVSKWSYTQIVRQADRAPVNPGDGVTVCTETTRNQYQTTGFVDITAESNVTYYYAAYAFNEDGVYSEVISNGVQPVSFNSVLRNNTWVEIDQACTLGVAPSLWEIGDTKSVTYQYFAMGGSRTIDAAILDFNHDDLSDGSGKAIITFGMREEVYKCNLSTGTYETSQLRDICQRLYELYLTEEGLKPIIKSIIKKSSRLNKVGTRFDQTPKDVTTTNDYLWALSMSELGFNITTTHEGNDDYSGAEYVSLNEGTLYPFYSTSSRRYVGDEYATRTSYTSESNGSFVIGASSNDGFDLLGAPSSTGMVCCFCIGKVAV